MTPWKRLMMGTIKGKKKSGQQRKRCSDSITDSMDMNLSKLWETVEDRGGWHATVHGVAKSRFFSSGDQTIGASASALVLPMTIQG